VGLVRLFQINLPPEQVESFSGDLQKVQHALGATQLDTNYVEVFALSDLTGLGLTGYMTEGLGIPAQDFAAEQARLDALEGDILVVLSRAFEGIAQTLTPMAPLRWIGTYAEESANVTFEPLPDESARGVAPVAVKKPTSNAAIQGRVATVVLIFLALFVWAFIKIAG
jgi:hypothetical protein